LWHGEQGRPATSSAHALQADRSFHTFVPQCLDLGGGEVWTLPHGNKCGQILAAELAVGQLEDVGLRHVFLRQPAPIQQSDCKRTRQEGTSGGDLPSFDASGDISLIDALVGLNFVASKKEARRMIQGGGARLDGDAVTDEDAVISAQAAPVKISAGKKKHGLINFV
jgi:hypothetical protein